MSAGSLGEKELVGGVLIRSYVSIDLAGTMGTRERGEGVGGGLEGLIDETDSRGWNENFELTG